MLLLFTHAPKYILLFVHIYFSSQIRIKCSLSWPAVMLTANNITKVMKVIVSIFDHLRAIISMLMKTMAAMA